MKTIFVETEAFASADRIDPANDDDDLNPDDAVT